MAELIRTLLPEELFHLCEARQSACLSMYLPTEKAGPPVRQNAIRFRNLVSYAREQAEIRCPYPVEEAFSLLSRIENLSRDEAFWRMQENGLALLLSEGEFFAIGLPQPVEAEVFFGPSFHCKPLVAMISNPSYAVFSLSQNGSQLFEQEPGVALRASLDLTMPGGIQDILQFVESEAQLRWHSLERGGGRKGPAGAIFHGQGGGGADAGEQKQRVLEYCRALDISLTPVYRRLEQNQVPLVVAAVEYIFSLFREVCTYRHLWPECIAGNFERERSEELAKRAEELLQPHFYAEQKRLNERIEQAADIEQGSSDPILIAHAAQAGYVDTVMLAEDRMIPVKIQFDDGRTSIKRTSEKWHCDLLDYITRHTLLNGGTVKLCPAQRLPAGGSVSVALFRRPVLPEFFGIELQHQPAALELR